MFLTCCPICQIFFTAEDSVMSTDCGHLFHESCIERWLSRAKSCPVCLHTTIKSKLIRLYLDNHSIEAPKSMGIDVRNRDGVFLRFIVRPIDTVGSLVRELLESHEVARVHDLRLNGISLLRGPGCSADSLLIRDCGIRSGCVINIVETPLVQCHVHLVSSEGKQRTLDVDLLDGEGVADLRQCVSKAFGLKSPSDLPLLYISGGITEGSESRLQRYNRVRMIDTQKEVLMNTRDQLQSTRLEKLTYYCRTFLQDGDYLPAIEGGAHVVKARADVEFWQMTSNPWTPFHRLSHVSPDLFATPHYCAWFSAHIVSSASGGERFFLHCFGDNFVDMQTGETVTDATKLISDDSDKPRRYAVIFVTPDVRFPRFNINGDNRLFLWCREGVRVWYSEGALKMSTNSKRPLTGTWISGRMIPDQLARYFKTVSPENIYEEADWCQS